MHNVTTTFPITHNNTPQVGDVYMDLSTTNNGLYLLTCVREVYATVNISTGVVWKSSTSISEAVARLLFVGRSLNITISK